MARARGSRAPADPPAGPPAGGETPGIRRRTAADVARLAGVSRATVSYVLNDTPHHVIPESTRERVRRAAASLDYIPSPAARALSSGRSHVVLLLLPSWPIGPSVGILLEQLSAAFTSYGYTFVAHPRLPDQPVSYVWQALTPAAVISFEELGEIDEARMRSAGTALTVALLGGPPGGPALDIPEQQTGRTQVEHLAAAGHTRLAYAWPDDPRVLGFARPRLEGVGEACAELGLPEPLVQTVALDVHSGASAVERWRAADPPVTAVCAYNDDVALVLLAGARVLGLTVPDDLAVIGVDDIPAAAVAHPGLTTVRVDLGAIARQIAETVSHVLRGEPASSRPRSAIHSVVARDSV